MERTHFRQVLFKACCEFAIIALGTWVSIVFAEVLDVPHWWLLVVCAVALVAAFFTWTKTPREKNNGTNSVEKKDESQEGVWRSVWQDFWYDMLPYWVRGFLAEFLFILAVFLMFLLITSLGKGMEWVKAL